MHLALILLFVNPLFSFPAQADLWQKVGSYNAMHLKNYAPSQAELVRVKKTIAARVGLDNWPCAEDDSEWTEKLKFEELHVSEAEKIVLVEAGPGCARGGQGSNGAMWIIRFQGDKFSFLATPQHTFNGWLYSIQQTTSHGFRDLVLGWHMGGGETGLSYFRFDGTSYQRIAAATQTTDEDNVEKIILKSVSGVKGCKLFNTRVIEDR